MRASRGLKWENKVYKLKRSIIREFTKPRRQRERERHQTEELNSRTIAVRVRYNSLYISFAVLCKTTT